MKDVLHLLLQGFEKDASLRQPDQIHRRLQALDVLDAHFAAGPESLCCDAVDAVILCRRAEGLSASLDALNLTLYTAVRAAIQRGNGAAALLQWMPGVRDSEPAAGMSYDSLDELVREVLAFEEPRLEPNSGPALMSREMVFYQPTPARHIVHLIGLLTLSRDDVLVDLGSGLGHVPLLVAILTAARGVGVELEASYVACARQCAEQLGLHSVSFSLQDARTADLSTGTVFYLHTPFTGSIMRTVLDRLRSEAEARPIRICTYGPCTAVVAGERWLESLIATETGRVAVFTSHACA